MELAILFQKVDYSALEQAFLDKKTKWFICEV